MKIKGSYREACQRTLCQGYGPGRLVIMCMASSVGEVWSGSDVYYPLG